MVFKLEKQERENSQNLIRRFTKRIKQSGLLMRVRKNRFMVKEKSPQLAKKAALRREELKEEYKELAKMGKLKKFNKFKR